MKVYILVDGEFFWVIALQGDNPVILGSSYFEDALPQDVMPYINSICSLLGAGDTKVFRMDVTHILRYYFHENYEKFGAEEDSEIEWVGESAVMESILRDRPDFLLAAKEADELGFVN